MVEIEEFIQMFLDVIKAHEKLNNVDHELNREISINRDHFDHPPLEIAGEITCYVHGVKISSQKKIDNNIEYAIYHALKLWKDELPKLDGYFHKAFRQVDVIEAGGDADMLMYNLLNCSSIFWELFRVVTEDIDEAVRKQKEKEKKLMDNLNLHIKKDSIDE